jgi:cell division protein FtsI (penicillin-binding protein 3)
MINLLLGAIDGGIARGARVTGYQIAGKTGTAEIAGPVKVRDAAGNLVTRTKYIPGRIDSSFISIYPASHPKLVTLILLHRPATWGRYLMVQRPESVFRLLAPQLLDYLAIPPDRPSTPVASR